LDLENALLARISHSGLWRSGESPEVGRGGVGQVVAG
jgi:hypothetical protein